ncbi:MAG: sugar ABC transporter substrate-binding protein [bacterium]
MSAVRRPLRLPLFVVLLLSTVSCTPRDDSVVLRFWAMGREGEVVSELLPGFEAEHPGVRVEVQQIPWSAAHEKMLTAFVGRSTPDVAQLGNTWIAEFAELGAIAPLDERIAASKSLADSSFFSGILETNRIDGATFGVPWYVDTRVVFYRRDFLAATGRPFPETWDDWRDTLVALRPHVSADGFPVFLPLTEWSQPVILGLQAGSPLLGDGDTRGAFAAPAFRRALDFYASLFREGLSPAVGYAEVGNIYQEFARGKFAMWITGPWNLGEMARRLPPELADAWGTAPLPGPTGAASGVSLAGGSSLVVFAGSAHPEIAWELVEYLARPEQQARFYRLTGDLPAHRDAWADSTLRADPNVAAFETQLYRVAPTPKVPEWESIASRVQQRVEEIVRGGRDEGEALQDLDRDADRLLEKRRWLRTHTEPAS